MECYEPNHQIITKLIIKEIFPSLEELNNNDSEMTISFQDKDNDIIFNLAELLLHPKKLELSFNSKSSSIKVIINKNGILMASGLLLLKNGEQWITLSYENKKKVNSNFVLNLLDCIKLKIKCKIISRSESLENSDKKENNLIKKNRQLSTSKKKMPQKEIDINYLTQNSLNTEEKENKKTNIYNESYLKTPTPNQHTSYTTINKNNIKKIDLSSIQKNKKTNNCNYTNLRNENIKDISSKNIFNSKKLFKKSDEGEYIGLATEIKPKKKNRGNKRSLEDINLNINKNKKNKSSISIKMENSKSSKILKKRKSGRVQQVNLCSLNCTNNSYFNEKNNKDIKKEDINPKNDNINVLKKVNQKESTIKSSKNKNNIFKNIAESNELDNNNDILFNMLKDYKNGENIDNDEIMINKDVEKIEDDNINNNDIKNKISNHINHNNEIIQLIDDHKYDENNENNEDDIFYRQLEDFKLLYSDDYIKSINNEYIKLEIELFIEKVIELAALYNNQIEVKNLEYIISKSNYYKNIFKFLETQKLVNKLNIMKYQFQLKKYNVNSMISSFTSNSINNLNTNKKQIKIFKDNLLEESLKKINHKKKIIKQIIKKLLEKEKNKNILNKNEKFKIWIKKNCIKKDNKKVKEKNVKNQKNDSKKTFSFNTNKKDGNNNKNLQGSSTSNNFRKNKSNKITNELKGKIKNKK